MSQSTSLGWQAMFSKPQTMPIPHAHDDIELNLLMEGSMEYILNGRPLKLEPNRLLAFWAATPHEVVETTGASFLWATVPLSDFMSWHFLGPLLNHLLNGRYAIGPKDLVSTESAKRWAHDFAGTEGNRMAAMLEIQAILLRLSDSVPAMKSSVSAQSSVDRIRSAIAERYAEEITVADLAKVAGLHPTHAMRIFKRATGASIIGTVASFRVAHAQRLLATTDLILPLVAIQSGFGSERRFHEVFRARTGMTPNQYRTNTRVKVLGASTNSNRADIAASMHS